MEYTSRGFKLNKNEILVKDDFLRMESLRNFSVPEIDFSDYAIFYFDSINGNDNNDGTSMDCAFKTLKPIAKFKKLKKPLKLLLKSGSVFRGNVLINGFYTRVDKPIVLASYGERNEFPHIIGDDSVIKITQSNVRLDGIEVSGPDAYRGIHILTTKKGVMKNIVISNCYVHDINWKWPYNTEAYNTDPDDIDVEQVTSEIDSNGERKGRYFYRYYGGIIAHNETGPSYFKNIYFLNNIITRVSRTALTIYGKWSDKPGVGYGYNKWVGFDYKNKGFKSDLGCFDHQNVVCFGNYLETVGADGIVISSVKNCLVSSNSCYKANYLGRDLYWNASIWVFNVTNCLFEYNHASKTYLRHFSNDGQGFDIDNSCQNVYMHHNYADHNEGGGLLICNLATKHFGRNSNGNQLYDKNGSPIEIIETGRWFNNYICNNLFYKNGTSMNKERSAFITIAREVDCSSFENNIIVIDENIKGQSIINTEDKETNCYSNKFMKNYFLCNKKTSAIFTDEMMLDSTFNNNYYLNVNPHYNEKKPLILNNGDILNNYKSIFSFENIGSDIFERKYNSDQLIHKLMEASIL